MEKQYRGIGSIELLLIVFIILKLTGNIEWDWVWVMSPLWVTLVFITILAVLAELFR